MIEASDTSPDRRCTRFTTTGPEIGTTKETNWVIIYRDSDEFHGAIDERVDKYVIYFYSFNGTEASNATTTTTEDRWGYY